MTSAVLDEALKKAALAWVSVGDGPALGLWCMPLEGSLIMVSGQGEQFAPGLAEATTATVRLRGDNGGLIVVSDMAVTRLLPGSEDWETVAPQLAQKRLNATGTFDDLVARWVESACAIVRLTPPEENAATAAPDLPTDSGAAPPRETPARVATRRPFRLHKVRGA
ncbi:hypothetical protein [Paractinoplanes durhamensis]|uniref:Uncharacterized protein n=1 Tax=Paractinoplanes durhamensis TaxID=113563 RepID=A0ABQ3YPT1_9ACTN|nr:hypothetical protein [Actinoplanes durhamensis]GID99594.1 hypothetical protein Adu01nite_09450 [Actinoplanes durhamensis]